MKFSIKLIWKTKMSLQKNWIFVLFSQNGTLCTDISLFTWILKCIYISLCREIAQWVLLNSFAVRFVKWSRKTLVLIRVLRAFNMMVQVFRTDTRTDFHLKEQMNERIRNVKMQTSLMQSFNIEISNLPFKNLV